MSEPRILSDDTLLPLPLPLPAGPRALSAPAGAGAGESELSGVVGLYFHVLDAHEDVERQGRVLGRVPGGFVRVLWYSWVDGRPNGEQLVADHEMLRWRFFLTNAEMVEAGDRWLAQRRQRVQWTWPVRILSEPSEATS